jgi:hypothetical protein
MLLRRRGGLERKRLGGSRVEGITGEKYIYVSTLSLYHVSYIAAHDLSKIVEFFFDAR